MELTELATIAGPVVALVGVALAIWALVYSKQSRDLAEQSSKESAKAIGLAEESNDIATDAKDVAEEANRISRRAEDRDTERHDVEWEHITAEPGVYELVNNGTDTAYRVRVSFWVGEWSANGACDEVGPGEAISVVIPEAVDEFELEMTEVREDRREEERVAQLRRNDPLMRTWIPGMVQVPDTYRFQHQTGYRAVWQTALGTQMIAEPKAWLEELADHNDHE
ncbi:hypothetical protein [Antrihabitans spumae]|uniref:Uncharacterized protein n=1 Tax=Antrihabitans spumae TaxID=3373370 RepID=A0ABW7K3Z2_9NOCA